MKRGVKVLIWIVAAGLVVFGLIQLVPYGRSHTNPPVTGEPNWDTPETRALAKRACFDCHSNETDWSRWYTNVAPASWLVQHDVDEARQRMNFSEWGQGGELKDIQEFRFVMQEGEMPPFQYLLLHSEAKLSQAEKDQLLNGLENTISAP